MRGRSDLCKHYPRYFSSGDHTHQTDGEVKLIAPLTLEYIADAVVSEGLAAETEIARLIAELNEFANAPGTMMSASPVVQAWGVRSSAK